MQQYRLRYVLAKLTQHIELTAYGETEGTKWLSRYTSGGYEIEHIYPQNPNALAKAEFGAITDSGIADRLGNLTLVEKAINASLGNRPFSEKRSVYPQSQLLLTRAISKRPKVGHRTRIDLAVASLEPFEVWNQANVETRQEMMRKLARTVWNVPAIAS